MGSGNITEVLRDLEAEYSERKMILVNYQKNTTTKIEVDKVIRNEGLRLKCQDSGSGNIWSNVENLKENLEKVNQEISLYEGLNRHKPRFR